ncbi:FAD:protein FMN transferase [Maliponia aquimaris]|uniref:FAD:protein FMN transferase n=1 Tax=Maliponia aquimaris TaxID=1673631 RepID=A0A238L2L8_9RHOB|nr:FAD:protein FMN transferase [Maliponia aquimaris]SMX49334.1 Thiamine biosynthesis lipoprotein ApbE precursor [Maliponia aquimaris]
MPTLSRRRFIAISASAAVLAGGPALGAPARHWTGVALGAHASITLSHPDAARIVAGVQKEIDRLEDIFSLYRTGSALMRLNRDGALDAPPFELVECLGVAGVVHAATGGAFDPTVQPLWDAYATAHAAGHAPTAEMLAEARRLVGWSGVEVMPSRIGFARPGMALTLNGIAQGYVADRVAKLLQMQGLDRILIDTGEFRALGGMQDGGAWPVSIENTRAVGLRDRALATSAALGTSFDQQGTVGHILDPRTGLPARVSGRTVSVTAPTAALADGLSTGLCLLDEAEATKVVGQLRDCRLV